MTLDFFLKAALVFGTTTVASVFWALYFRYSTQGRGHKAALADCGIICIGAINVISYTQNHWLLIPILLGTYLGTYVAIRKKAKAVEVPQ